MEFTENASWNTSHARPRPSDTAPATGAGRRAAGPANSEDLEAMALWIPLVN